MPNRSLTLAHSNVPTVNRNLRIAGMQKLSQDAAQEIAVSALTHLAGDDDLLMRFAALSGIQTTDMRTAAGEPGFLVGVLDFFLSHEPDLLTWTSAHNIDPEQVFVARHALQPEDHGGFE